jgi:DNA-directed RNA polymerase specialized sigma24 family protein
MGARDESVSVEATRRDQYSRFAREAEPRLHIALAAAVGQEFGADATAEALAYGWEHWERIERMDNPVGYLYRVGRTSVRAPRRAYFPPPPATRTPIVEPALPSALAKLTDRQRVAVVLVHGFDWSPQDVAALLEIDTPTVATHLRRGLAKLRKDLKVAPNA